MLTIEQFENKKLKAISSAESEIKDILKRVLNIQTHTLDMCKSNSHIIDGYATGGGDGEYFTYCRVCDFKTYGYD